MKKIYFILAVMFSLQFITSEKIFSQPNLPHLQWARFMNGPGSVDDLFGDMDVDSAGNCYTLGWNSGLLISKYDPEGRVLWEREYDDPIYPALKGKSIKVDKQGNVFVVGDNHRWHIIKYNSEGQLLWVRYVRGYVAINEASRMVLDDEGNVYVTGGSSINPGQISDIVTVKYSNNGDSLWTQSESGTYNGERTYDFGKDIALDDSNNVYVTGVIGTSIHPQTLIIVKYDNNGKRIWKRERIPEGYGDSYGYSIKVQNNSVIAGGSTSKSTGITFYLLKYNLNGEFLWENVRFSPLLPQNSNQNYIKNLTVDNIGNIYACGVYDLIGGGYDFTIVKYSESGAAIWIKRITYPAIGFDECLYLSTDENNNIYASGVTNELNQEYRLTIIKLNPSGDIQWMLKYPNTISSGGSRGEKIILHKTGYYIGGNFAITSSLGFEILTLKYSLPVNINNQNIILLNNEILNYPNPFNPISNFKFRLIKQSKVNIKIYSIAGKLIETITDGIYSAGETNILHNFSNYSSGVYYYTFAIDGDRISTNKLILVK